MACRDTARRREAAAFYLRGRKEEPRTEAARRRAVSRCLLLPPGEGGAKRRKSVRVRADVDSGPNPHPPFGHLLPEGEGSAAQSDRSSRKDRSCALGGCSVLPSRQGGAKRRMRVRDCDNVDPARTPHPPFGHLLPRADSQRSAIEAHTALRRRSLARAALGANGEAARSVRSRSASSAVSTPTLQAPRSARTSPPTYSPRTERRRCAARAAPRTRRSIPPQAPWRRRARRRYAAFSTMRPGRRGSPRH